jgi:DNA-binding LacI/PurR family transcriptional regulator
MDERTGRRATIADVAELAGVSRAAVSKVFNSKGGISAATADRIRAAARELSWTPSVTATALRRARTRALGLVLGSTRGQPELGASRSVLIEGIESVISEHDYGLMLFVADITDIAVYHRIAQQKRVDGVILLDSLVEDGRFEAVREAALPAVLLGTPWVPDPIPSIDSDPPAAGVAESVRLLYGLGHRQIAYVGGPRNRVAALLREQAYQHELGRLGLTSFATVETDYSAEEAAVRTTELLTGSARPTAIMYANDPMAVAGMRLARQLGLRVPADLSIVGYEGAQLSEWTDPAITTVVRDSWERGQVAAATLLHLLGELVEIPPIGRPRLEVRASTGPAPASAIG